jgi:hypothetical protein
VAAAILSHPLEAVIVEGRVAVHRPTRPARDTGAKWTLASASFAVENLLNRKALPLPGATALPFKRAEGTRIFLDLGNRFKLSTNQAY